MADKYYAWNNFAIDRDEFGRSTKTVSVGDEVTASTLGVSAEQFQEYINNGAVRTMQYPADVPRGMAPAEWFREQAAKMSSADYVEQMNQLAAQAVEPATPAPASEPATTDKK